MSASTFSVCIPARNRARYLAEAVGSVLGQSFGDLELLVFDDASRDATQEVLACFDDPRLRVLRSGRRLGAAGARNACLAQARGRYLAWLDSDDAYLPDALARLALALESHPGAGLAHGGFHVVDGAGRRLPDWPAPFEADAVERGEDAVRELLLSNYVTTSTVAVRRECCGRVGPFACDLERGQDWEMWLRIALRADLAYVAAPLARYRYHEGSVTVGARRVGASLGDDAAVVRRIFRRERVPDRRESLRQARLALAAKALHFAGEAFAHGRRATAVRIALRALRLAPHLAPGGLRYAAALAAGDEVGAYRHGKALFAHLYAALEGTRFARTIEKLARDDPDWRRAMESAARAVRRVVPAPALVAAVDKHDPTLLHLSGRRGWHVPDLGLLPDGYPPDGEAALAHVAELRERGAEYLVFPSASFWWLDFYEELRHHLDEGCRRVWSDPDCVVYRLAP